MFDLTDQYRTALHLADEFTCVQEQSPSDRASTQAWIRRFKAAGFFHTSRAYAHIGGQSSTILSVSFVDSRPRKAIPLYRVCDPGLEHRLSWTASLATALRYGPDGGHHAAYHSRPHLYTTLAPRARVLAILQDEEYITDTAGLEIRDVGGLSPFRPAVQRASDMPERMLNDPRVSADQLIALEPAHTLRITFTG